MMAGSRTFAIRTFLVVGWFLDNKTDPKEMCLKIQPYDKFLFANLHSHIMVLRGWRPFLSFKFVQGFGLYKV